MNKALTDALDQDRQIFTYPESCGNGQTNFAGHNHPLDMRRIKKLTWRLTEIVNHSRCSFPMSLIKSWYQQDKYVKKSLMLVLTWELNRELCNREC